MDKIDYNRRRQLLIQRLLGIPTPKLFPRSVRKILKLIANLDAEYLGETMDLCYQRLLDDYKDKIAIKNDNGVSK